jgi:Ribbon-helix-helix protein, copG family
MVSREQREKDGREKSSHPRERFSVLRVRLPADEMAALHSRAREQKQSETALVREAVRRYLGLKGRNR